MMRRIPKLDASLDGEDMVAAHSLLRLVGSLRRPAAALGVEAARPRVAHLADQARAHLDIFGPDAEILRASVDYVLQRRS